MPKVIYTDPAWIPPETPPSYEDRLTDIADRLEAFVGKVRDQALTGADLADAQMLIVECRILARQS